MCTDPALSTRHAAADPGFARGQRALLRQQRQEQGALGEALEVQLRAPRGIMQCARPQNWQQAGLGVKGSDAPAYTLPAALPAVPRPVQAQEQYDQPDEQFNEAGDPFMPFSLRQELSVSTGTERSCRGLAREFAARASAVSQSQLLVPQAVSQAQVIHHSAANLPVCPWLWAAGGLLRRRRQLPGV